MRHHLSVLLVAVVIGPGLAANAFAQSAALEFERLSAADGVTLAEWVTLAREAVSAGNEGIANQALEKAAETWPQPQILIERASQAAGSGEREQAIGFLEQVAAAGFPAVQLVTGDKAFDVLRGDTRFDQVVAMMNRAAFPCRFDEAFRAFDFWIGEWDVHTAGGQLAGQNSIRSEEAGCVLTEHWTGAGGGTGSSINYLDRATGEWVQVWNSQGGAQISIRGGMSDAGMRLAGHIHYVGNGTTADFRGLWTPLEDGRVRQYFEQSNDGGETWTPWFEGFYTRRTQPEG